MRQRVAAFFRALARAWRGRYVLMLERENARLRSENRALTNSLLGTAGFPPLAFGDDDSAAARAPLEAPVRRRSWPQIAMQREREATRQAAMRAAHARRD
jgi:hypothetical protein